MRGLRVTGQAPSQQLLTDFTELRRLADEPFALLLEACLGCLQDPEKAATFTADIEHLAAQTGSRVGSVRNGARGLLVVLRTAAQKGEEGKDLGADLHTLGLTEARAEAVVKQYTQHVHTISSAVIARALQGDQLRDIDWKLGIVAGTSEQHTDGNVFVQMRLAIERAGRVEHVLVELNLKQFYSLMHELERAKSTLEAMAAQ
eukprot:comp20252_c0_seq1/m.25332 comp20252_c0_seq1/g.25332  ORF comp20252_c0_seq1/g.25332 comp20252_c0_seq1/m.25332 type:complete len:203 (-) comp20252_c0_seq1:4-612(-)